MSLFVEQSATVSQFDNPDAWVVLSKDEQIIKQKIEKVGTPLKDWDINIYRGVLTGFNEAFIIDGKTKDALIAQDPKCCEIIRPILRGKDIKKYTAEFADLWLIATHNGIKSKEIPRINVEKDYPSVFEHLKQYQTELQARQDKGDHWTNLRNCAYWEEFEKKKIIYPNMTKYLPFTYDDKNNYYSNDKSFIINGKHIEYLVLFFNSSLFKYCFRDNFPELQGGTRELRKVFFDTLSVKLVSDTDNGVFSAKLKNLMGLKQLRKSTHKVERDIENMIFDLYGITEKERNQILNSEKVQSINQYVDETLSD